MENRQMPRKRAQKGRHGVLPSFDYGDTLGKQENKVKPLNINSLARPLQV